MNSQTLDSQIAQVGARSTFIDVLRSHTEGRPSQLAITFLERGEEEKENITFSQLNRKARAIGAFLQKEGMQGERAILLLPSGDEFISTFLGCLYASVIAVPAFPFHFDGSQRGESWFRSVTADAQPRVAFAAPEMIARSSKVTNDALVSSIRWHDPQSIDLSLADEWREPVVNEETVAFLQYTSGSTSSPKGVMVSHGNVLHNMKVIQSACKTGEDSTVVTWLPLYHDMGLIGTVLQPLYLGARCVVMGPTAFLQKPLRWLQALSQYRAHSSSAPNFAYDLCARKISPVEKEGLDLSGWRVAVNGAEPVRPETMERFAAAFHKCGFSAGAFHPSYGLAESTLMVTGGRPVDALKSMRLSAEALERNVVQEASGNEPARVLAGCGAVPDEQLKIVDPSSRELCGKGAVGEIWVSSPSVAQGYWNQPEETATTFQAQLSSDSKTRFLRTGDLGFVAGGQLFITGRLKDLIILNGRNLYPHDIELTVQQCHPTLRAGCGAAFAVEVDGQEALVVVNEVDRHSEASPEELLSEIRKTVLLEHGIQIYSLMLLKSGDLPKTTSGKIKRAACRAAFLAGEMQAVASSTLPMQETEAVSADERLTKNTLLQIEPGLRLEFVESYLQEQIARIAKIDLKAIRPDQPLVSLGLDSLGASELARRIATEVGVQVDVASLLEGLSLGRLAEIIVDQVGASEETQVFARHSSKGESWPLSHGQRGLWVLHKLAPHSVAYTLASAVRVAGRLNVPALEKAFLQVMERHEMLRAVFSAASGEPVQLIQAVENVDPGQHVQRIDLSEAEAARLRERLGKEIQEAFLLEKTPPIRLFAFGLPTKDDVLMLVVHHIVADLWSIGTILQELGAAYLAHRDGHAVVLPELNSSYLDYIAWQSKRVCGPEGESLLDYWRNQLCGDLPVLQLPVDRPRPPIFSYRGASEPLSLGPDLYSKIQSIARAEAVTPFMLLVAAFQVLLHRISRQQEVLIGSPVNGRSKPGFAPVVGYFANPVVLRSSYDGTIAFRSYLAQVRQSVLQALKHQDYPFPLLVEQLRPKREGGTSPIFQAMFVWQELPGSQGEALAAASFGETRAPLQFADAQAELVPLENSGSQFDLTLLMSASGNELLGSLKYSSDLFDRATIQRLGRQFSVLLSAIVDDPRLQLSALPLMTSAERSQLLSQCSMGREPSPGQVPIHELFERQVERDPSAIALIVGEKQMTFGQLNAQANQFARYLRILGVEAESLVGICLERSPEMVAALLGIWKAGGVYVPLDTHDPRARLAAMVGHLQALITHEHLLDRLPEQLPPVVLLDLDLDIIAQESDSNLNIKVDGCNLAYVIHTSGSTGSPKGVMIEHRCVNNLLRGLSEAIYAHSDRWIVGVNAPFTFDSSMKQIITMAMGHTLCLIPEKIRRNGPELQAYMQAMHLDVLDCTPTQVQLLLETGLGESEESTTLLLGGEPVPEHIWQVLVKRKLKPCYNVYGPTECTVDATQCRIDSEPHPSIGRPLSGTNIYILDENLELAPLGVVGEIFIGGHSVGRGYLDRPDLTAEQFLPDHLSGAAGTRMYRTGDCGYWLPNGSIRFVGRADRQIKVRGFRIEPGEIETALRAQPGVQEAAVVSMDIGNGSNQLVAYVVSTKERASNHYRQVLSETLPDYMLPAVVVSIASIPVNAHGKRDYSALPVPDIAELERDDFTPPQSQLEQYLVNLWTRALRVQPIGIHDNFFSLGGDSLQATKMVTQVQEEYPSDMPLLALFFQEPTIASLARFIETRKEIQVQSA